MDNLRDKIADAQYDYFAKYGCLDWHWYDEGIIWTIQDYYSRKGEFSDDDIAVLTENDLMAEDFMENDNE